MSQAEQVLFLYDQLDGVAKAELEFHDLADRDDAEKIFSILTEKFSCSQSYFAVQLHFFQRSRREGESLRLFPCFKVTYGCSYSQNTWWHP